MSLYKEGDPAERARTIPLPPEGVNPETFRVALEAYQELQKSGELPESPLPITDHETKGSTAKERYLQRMANQDNSGESAEEGEVLPKEPAPGKPSKPRPTDNLMGKEVIVQSSKKPVVMRPPLGASRIELFRDRDETHLRVAYKTAKFLAHPTGFVDGVTDSGLNLVAELGENSAFFISKTYHGVRHGWSRGKIQGG